MTTTMAAPGFTSQHIIGHDLFAELEAAKALLEDTGYRKFEAIDVDSRLFCAAVAHMLNYQTAISKGQARFEFMDSMVDAFGRYSRLSAGQVKGILNCLRADMVRQQQETKVEEPATPAEAMSKHTIRNGTYTVILNGDDDYVTIKIKDAKFAKGMPEGTQMACYMSGPDNDGDFTGYAFVQGRTAKIWRRFSESTRIVEALQILLNGDASEAGERYAMESGNCYCCGRKLTVPASLHRGLGPVCAGREV